MILVHLRYPYQKAKKTTRRPQNWQSSWSHLFILPFVRNFGICRGQNSSWCFPKKFNFMEAQLLLLSCLVQSSAIDWESQDYRLKYKDNHLQLKNAFLDLSTHTHTHFSSLRGVHGENKRINLNTQFIFSLLVNRVKIRLIPWLQISSAYTRISYIQVQRVPYSTLWFASFMQKM